MPSIEIVLPLLFKRMAKSVKAWWLLTPLAERAVSGMILIE
ncbi:MAG TPA: hypothetical protein VFE51_17905 [Verrucomicrobiae bacterium]|nr:hypothetical protein [Verrucomicrobiae bacterium]